MNKLRGVLALTLAAAGVMLGAQPTFATASTLPEPDADGVITLTEDVELSAGFVVGADENITLDLGTYTLSSTLGLEADLITVELGGTLTILGSGTVDSSYLADNYAALYNNGTVSIGTADNYFTGTFILDVTFQNLGDVVYYLILNHGDLTIYGGTYLSNDYRLSDSYESSLKSGSSMIENGYTDLTGGNPRSDYVEGTNHEYPTLTIYAGTFGDATTGSGLNTIKNDEHGILYIHGGTFTNTWKSVLFNYGEAHIYNGEFIATAGLARTIIFNNKYSDDSAGIIKIHGGTFEGESLFSIDEEYTPEDASIKVYGGTYRYSGGLWFWYEGLSAEEAVAKVEVTGLVYAPQSMLAIAKAGATVYITDYQQYDLLTPAEGVTVLLADYSTKADDTDIYTYSLYDMGDGSYIVVRNLNAVEGGAEPEPEPEPEPDTGGTSGTDDENSGDTGDAEGGTTDEATDDAASTTDTTSDSATTTSSKTSPQTSDVNLIGLLAVTALAAITFVSSVANYRRESQA